MTTERRTWIIQQSALDLEAFEADVAARLERAQPQAEGYPDVLAVLHRLAPQVQRQRAALAAYLGDAAPTSAGQALTSREEAPEPAALSETLREISLGFQRCNLGAAMLYEVGLRLYEVPVREIAQDQMQAHAEAALSTARLLPLVVATELARDGLDCACCCPICGVGACGCVSWGTEAMMLAWRDAAAAEVEPTGFVLLPPRAGSGLARAGVQAGDLILAVDGHGVHGRQEVQDALRKRALGDAVQVLVQRGRQAPRVVTIQHAGDYPKG